MASSVTLTETLTLPARLGRPDADGEVVALATTLRERLVRVLRELLADTDRDLEAVEEAHGKGVLLATPLALLERLGEREDEGDLVADVLMLIDLDGRGEAEAGAGALREALAQTLREALEDSDTVLATVEEARWERVALVVTLTLPEKLGDGEAVGKGVADTQMLAATEGD
jgi:hypothetical protein